MSYIDITVPLKNGMVRFPEDPPIEITPVFDMRKGTAVNVTQYSFGSHSATHIDPPFHLMIDGKKADEIPADYFFGKAKVFDFGSEDIDLKNLQSLDIEKGDMVLLKTSNSRHMFEDAFFKDYVTVAPAAAEYFANIGVRTVGVDYLSIEKYDSLETHQILLSAGIPIIEGLNLSEALPGIYKMTAMFMLVENSDGAPIRVILEKY